MVTTVVTDITGEIGIIPRIVRVNTSATLSQVTTANFLQSTLNQGYTFYPTDLVAVSYNGGNGFFNVSIGISGITLTQSFISTINNAGQIISAIETSATPGTVRALTGKITETATVMTSGNIVGLRGEADMVGASGGFVYGVQGKVIPTGTLSSSVWVAGVFGQFDLSHATITTGQLAAVWADYGTTATAGTYTGARLYAGTNTTAAILNSNLYLYGAATNIFEFDDNNGLSGATYFQTAGTGANSAGASSYAAGTKVLQISVNGTNYWLKCFTSNS
jgi:hypothetical protein